MSTLEECDALIAEVHMALHVFADAGRFLAGHDLLRWRKLPPFAQEYFTALVAPHVDPHAMTRTGCVVFDMTGRSRVVATPPHIAPCDCAAPVFADYSRDSVRCSECLRSWRMHRRDVPNDRAHMTHPLCRAVLPARVGRALEEAR